MRPSVHLLYPAQLSRHLISAANTPPKTEGKLRGDGDVREPSNVDWYRSTEGMPPLNVLVMVQWGGREFPAKRRPNPRRGNLIEWMVETSEGLISFPPKKLARRLGPDPELWRPVDPKRWVYMLPEPVRFQVSPPGPTPTESSPPALPGERWWADEAQVPRTRNGFISAKEAEGRVLRALCTMRSIKVLGPRQKSNADVLARYSAAPLSYLLDDIEGLRHDWRPVFEPTGRDLDDFLVASRWFEALNPIQMSGKRRGRFSRLQMALILRAADPPWTWAAMGDRWGVSGERARQIYLEAVNKLSRAANGQKVFQHLPSPPPPLPRRSNSSVHID